MAWEKLSTVQKQRKDAGLCIRCGAEANGKTACPPHMREVVEKSKQYAAKLRKEVFDHYGNKCACCGEDEPKFLTMDHMGFNLTREITGTPFYNRLRNEGYPEGYQVLCYNCNCGRKRGPCPHTLR